MSVLLTDYASFPLPYPQGLEEGNMLWGGEGELGKVRNKCPFV